jgi:hypothetical protein
MQRNNNPERLPLVAAADFVKRQLGGNKPNPHPTGSRPMAGKPKAVGLTTTCAENGTTTLLSVAQM